MAEVNMGVRGDWIQTFTGRRFYPFSPMAEDVAIEDIAHSLAMQCRFTGHTSVFYSVAEHSVHVATVAASLAGVSGSRLVMLAGLLHDASEAYLIDVARPVKRDPRMASYRDAERAITLRIRYAFGLPQEDLWQVEEADKILLGVEALDLMPEHECWDRWIERARPYLATVDLQYWPPAEAKRQFLALFDAIRAGGGV